MSLRKIHTETCGPRVVKVYHDSEWCEFQCRLYVNTVLQREATYHTWDREDAIDTAKAMVMPLPTSRKETRQ